MTPYQIRDLQIPSPIVFVAFSFVDGPLCCAGLFLSEPTLLVCELPQCFSGVFPASGGTGWLEGLELGISLPLGHLAGEKP